MALLESDRIKSVGDVAQLVEQRTENPCVGGSIPSVTTKSKSLRFLGLFFVMDIFYVYILQSQINESFYKGSTNNLLRRFEEHNAGEEIATNRYLPWDLVWYTTKPSRSEAYVLEKKLKNLSVIRTIDFIKKYPVNKSIEVSTVKSVREVQS